MENILIMLRPEVCAVVAVSILAAEPTATSKVSGLNLDAMRARVGCGPLFCILVINVFPVPTVPAATSYGYAVTFCKFDTKIVFPSALRATPWLVCVIGR